MDKKIHPSSRSVAGSKRQKRAQRAQKAAKGSIQGKQVAHESVTSRGRAAELLKEKPKEIPIKARQVEEAPKQSWFEYGRSIFERRASIVKEGVGLPKKLFEYAVGQNIRNVGNLMHKKLSTFAPPALETFLKVYGIVIGTYDPEHPDEFNREIAALSKALKLKMDNIAPRIAGTYNWGTKISDRTSTLVASGVEKLLVYEMEYRIKNLSKHTFIKFVNAIVKELLSWTQLDVDPTHVKVLSYCLTDTAWTKLSGSKMDMVALTKTTLGIISIPLFNTAMSTLLSQYSLGYASKALIMYIMKQVIAVSRPLLKKLSVDKVIINVLREFLKIIGNNLGSFCVCLYYCTQ